MKHKTTIITLVLLLPLVTATSFSSQIHSPSISSSIPLDSIFVNNIGASTFSIPIEVPPGTNGLQPSLTLSYNSFARNSYPGLVGSGWGITESYIQRDTEYTAANTSDDSFILVLDGQAMKIINDSGTFRTEVEAFLQIQEDENNWQVRTKDGTTYAFSQTLDSNLYGFTWRWHLKTVTDTFGNNITYNYLENPSAEDNGTLYLDTIQYNNDKSRVISFSYESLPTSWAIIDNGNVVKRTRRINEIQVNASENLVRKYTLDYTTNERSTRSYLSEVTEHGSDGSSTLPSTKFNYTSIVIGWERDTDLEDSLPDLEFSWDGVDSGTRALDFTRNGKIDFIQNANVTGDQSDTYNSSLNGYDESSEELMLPPMNMSFTEIEGEDLIDRGVRLGDFDGNGLIDLIRGYNDSDETVYEIWENYGPFVGWDISNSTFVTEFSNNNENQGVELVDLNGDGFVDVVKAKQGEEHSAWINNQSGGWDVDNNWNLPVDLVTSNEEDTGTRLIDFNGDRLVDIYVSNTTGQELWLNDGYGWFLSNWNLNGLPDNIDASGVDQGVRFADINDDGLTDVVQAQGVLRLTLLNTGEAFTENSSWDIPDWGEFVELDGENEGTRFIDANNDGLVDVVRIKRNGGSLSKAAWVNRADKQFLLDTIELPAGSIMRFEYIRSSDSADWDVGFNQWVLESVAQYDNLVHQEQNGLASCSPSACPAEYVDQGVDCSGENNCTRICQKITCDEEWSVINDDTEDYWSDQDFDSGGAFVYEYTSELDSEDIPSDQDKCYKITANSEGGIVDDSDLSGVSLGTYDSAMALSFAISDLNEQDIDDYCGLSDDGDIMNSENYYLKDDSDPGDDFQSADSISIDNEIAYCTPSESKCLQYEGDPCSTRCYGETWSFIHHVEAGVDEAYVHGAPASVNGACQVGGPESSGPYIDYITYGENKDYSFMVEEASVDITNDNQVCLKTRALITSYSYEDGKFDYEDHEFRGFGEVTETRPDGTSIVHYFHQDDARKGLEYKIETGSIQIVENMWNFTNEGSYFIVLLQENNITDVAGTDQKVKATNYTYDQYGNPITIAHKGDLSDASDDWFEEFEYTYNVDTWIVDKPKHHIIKENNGSIFSEEWFYYDDNGLDVSPTQGALTNHTQFLDSNTNISNHFTYDSFGNVEIETNGRGFGTTYDFEETGTFRTSVTNSLAQVSEFGYDVGTGNVLNETDPNGYLISYIYDVFGRKTKEVHEGDSVDNPTVSWSYELDGVAPELIKEVKKISPEENVSMWNFYDGFNNLGQTRTEVNATHQTVTDFFYGALQKLQNESNWYFISLSETYTAPDSSVPRKNLDFDPLGRTTRVENADGSFRNTIYFIWDMLDTDENENQLNTSYDAFGRISTIIEFNAGEEHTTSYDYDVNDNVILITDNEANTFSFTYDSLGRLSQIDDPDLGLWTYSYDEQGNLLTQEDANDNQVTMTYDALDRVLTKSSNGNEYGYTYDIGTIGILSNLTGPNYQYDYEYDQRLRLTQELKTVAGQALSINYSYDNLDRLVQKNISNSEPITFIYAKGWLESLNEQINFTYNPFSQPTRREFNNNLVTSLDYYLGNQRVKSISTSTEQDLEYQYDPVGNVVEINDSDNTISISYDNLDRVVTSVSDDFNYTYSYDSLGNILTIFDYVEGGNNYTFAYASKPVHSPQNISIDDTTVPVVTALWADPSPQGLGANVTINAEIIDFNGSADVRTVLVGIIPPGEAETNYSMNNISSTVWQYTFTDYSNGTYIFTVYVNDSESQENLRSGTVEMYGNLKAYIQTQSDAYQDNEFVNITGSTYIEYSTIEEFNNSYSIENLTYDTRGNITRYINISKGAVVTNATLTLNGFGWQVET